MATPASPRDPSLEQRALDLQLQIEQVNAALQQIRQTYGSLQQVESRLAEMTSECAGILDRWAKNDERHALAVSELHSRLSEWNDLERKLLAESANRIHQFERGVQHEWQALRQKHEEPLQRLDAQATRVTENCLAAVDAALRGFDRAEARLQAVEQQVASRLSELSHEVRTALAEARQPALAGTGPRPWPLEEVMRLHTELRAEADARDESGGGEESAFPPTPKAALPNPPSLESPLLLSGAASEPSTPGRRRGWIALAAAVVILLTASVVHLRQQLEVALGAATARAAAAEQDAETARRLAREQITQVQRTAEQQIASAHEAAQSAQLTANVLAAPDLYRLDLGGTARAPRAAAQVLWSRSRGIVFSGSRLPTLPDGYTYQLWMITQEGPVAVGIVTPDASGRVTAGFEAPARLPRPVTGASVTLETSEEVADGPTGPAYLSTPPPSTS